MSSLLFLGVAAGGIVGLAFFDVSAALTVHDFITYILICILALGASVAFALRQKGVIREFYLKWDIHGNRIDRENSTDFRDSRAALLISGILSLIAGGAGLLGGVISHAGAVWINSENPLTYYAVTLFVLSLGVYNLYRFAKSPWLAEASSE